MRFRYRFNRLEGEADTGAWSVTLESNQAIGGLQPPPFSQPGRHAKLSEDPPQEAQERLRVVMGEGEEAPEAVVDGS